MEISCHRAAARLPIASQGQIGPSVSP